MGNHEYCTGCGMSDFHSGRSCQEAYPKQYREHQREKRAIAKKVGAARASLRRLAKAIHKTFGVKPVEDGYDGELHQIKIHFWDAQKAEQKRRK